MNRSIQIVVPLCIAICVIAAPLAAQKSSSSQGGTRHTTAKPAPIVEKTPSDGRPAAKVIQYGPRDLVKIQAKLRYTTLIVLPPNERILEAACGDKDYWTINATENIAYVKPAKAGAQTNVNLVTASGNIYSFLLADVSESPGTDPDLKVFIEPKDDSMIAAAEGAPRFISARQAEDYRQQIQAAKEETRQIKETTQSDVDARVTKFIDHVRFAYRFEAGKKPFYVRAMYHDDNFTYIQARPEETPTLYELKDKKPNFVNFEYKDGIYVVSKILERGFLVVGKKKLPFRREE
jgi:type IV secretory pathway VirB9-like protein